MLLTSIASIAVKEGLTVVEFLTVAQQLNSIQSKTGFLNSESTTWNKLSKLESGLRNKQVK